MSAEAQIVNESLGKHLCVGVKDLKQSRGSTCSRKGPEATWEELAHRSL